MKNSDNKVSKAAKKALLTQLKSCLDTYYNLPSCKRNQWRANQAFESAKQQIEKATYYFEIPFIQGAQWGGKWGNYCRLIALNSKKEYQYVEGFNPRKYLI